MGICCSFYTRSKYKIEIQKSSTSNCDLKELNKNIQLINNCSSSISSISQSSSEENLGSQVRSIRQQEQQNKDQNDDQSNSKINDSKSNVTHKKKSMSKLSQSQHQSQGNSDKFSKPSMTSKRSVKTIKTYITSKSLEHQNNNPKEDIKEILSYRQVMEQLAQEAKKTKQYVIFVTNEQILAEQEEKMYPSDDKYNQLQYLVVGGQRKKTVKTLQPRQENVLSKFSEEKKKIEIYNNNYKQEFTSDPEQTIKTFISFYNTVKDRNNNSLEQSTLKKQNQYSTLDSSKNCTSNKKPLSLEIQMETNLAAYKQFLAKNEFNNQNELMQFAQVDSALQRIFFLMARKLKQEKLLNFE